MTKSSPCLALITGCLIFLISMILPFLWLAFLLLCCFLNFYHQHQSPAFYPAALYSHGLCILFKLLTSLWFLFSILLRCLSWFCNTPEPVILFSAFHLHAITEIIWLVSYYPKFKKRNLNRQRSHAKYLIRPLFSPIAFIFAHRKENVFYLTQTYTHTYSHTHWNDTSCS